MQLYTLRELTARSMAAALNAVAGIGYDGVELAGLTDLSAAETAEDCRRLGLEICGAHIGLDRFDAEPEAVAEELRVLGTTEHRLPVAADRSRAPPRSTRPAGGWPPRPRVRPRSGWRRTSTTTAASSSGSRQASASGTA